MNRFGVRRLATSVQVSIGVAAVIMLANCSGGERPPPAEDTNLDAGRTTTDAPGGPTIVGYDATKGIVFGDDGLVNCGTQAGAQTITLRNPGTDIVNFNASLTVGGDLYKVTPAAGGIPARGSIDVQITPAPIPSVSDVTSDLFAGTLSVKIATIDTPINIRLHQTARGAIVTTSFTGDAYDFGDVKVNTSSPKSFSLTNAGNLDVTANLQLGNPLFQVNGATIGAVPLAGGKTVSQTLSFEPTDLVPSTDTLAVTFNTSAVHCGKKPNNVSLKGNGTSSVGVAPGTLNFGLVNCGGAPAGPQTITITTTIGMNFTPQLGEGTNSHFSLANDGSGLALSLGVPIPLAANGSYVMRIVPKVVPIPSSVVTNALGDTLTITTDAPQDKPHAVTLTESAQGAIFTLTPTQITQNGGISAQLDIPFSLINAGNLAGPYAIAVTSDGPSGSFTSNLTSGTAAVGSLGGIAGLTMPPSNGASYHGTLSVTAPGAVLCADLPPAMPINATAAGTSITTVPSTLDFGFVNCGTTATFQTISISSTAATDITPTLGAGTSSPFTLADSAGAALPSPVHIAAGGNFVMRVVPKPISIPSPVAIRQIYPAGLGDILTLTSTVDPPKSIRLDQTAQGAIFSFNPPTIAATGPVQLVNSGNAAGAWTIGGSGGTSIPSSGTLGTAPANTSTLAITRGGAGSLTISAPSTVICADLPTLTIN